MKAKNNLPDMMIIIDRYTHMDVERHHLQESISIEVQYQGFSSGNIDIEDPKSLYHLRDAIAQYISVHNILPPDGYTANEDYEQGIVDPSPRYADDEDDEEEDLEFDGDVDALTAQGR